MFSIKRTTATALAGLAIAGAAGVPAASAHVPAPDHVTAGIGVRGLDDMHNAAVQAAAGTANAAPDVAAVKAPAPSPSGGGIDWAGVGVGAGFAAALLLAAAAVGAVRRPARMRAH